jgi:hypothetical protein
MLLRLDKWDAMETFNDHGISDLWFPFPKQTLRYLLNDPKLEKRFLHIQEQELLQDSWPDEEYESAPHVVMDDGEDVIKSERILGEGGFAIVDQVTLPKGAKSVVCVRKRIGRTRQLKAQKQIIGAFSCEIKVMSQVNHRHCVEFLGSYTDQDTLGILSLPVADMDLAAFLNLEMLSEKQIMILNSGIGCLCNALHYLHQCKIRSVLENTLLNSI